MRLMWIEFKLDCLMFFWGLTIKRMDRIMKHWRKLPLIHNDVKEVTDREFERQLVRSRSYASLHDAAMRTANWIEERVKQNMWEFNQIELDLAL